MPGAAANALTLTTEINMSIEAGSTRAIKVTLPVFIAPFLLS
jgi:hypothetical protein